MSTAIYELSLAPIDPYASSTVRVLAEDVRDALTKITPSDIRVLEVRELARV